MILRKNKNSSYYNAVGVDIGNFSVKIAALKREPFNEKRMLSFAVEYIPIDASLEQKVNLIQKAMANIGIVAKRVNTSVCGPNVICRYIRLPLMHKYELQDAIELEWDKYINLKKEEVVWDYTLLDTITNSTGKFMQVLMVVVKKNFLEERINLLKAAGLEPQIINIDALALINTFKFTNPLRDKHPIVILNIGEYFTNEVILKNDICWFSRDIQMGGRDITGIISEKFHVSLVEAEDLKRSLDTSKGAEIYSVIRPVLDNLANELKLSLEYFEREIGDRISCIYIFGGSANLYQLDEFLSEGIGTPIKKWNIAQSFSLSPQLPHQALEKYSYDLAVAIGLALIKKGDL